MNSQVVFATALLHHLRHGGTFLGTCAASFSAGSQLLVIRELLAGSGASLTALGTASGHGSGKRTLSGAKSRATFATVSTIHACIHALEIVFLSCVNHISAMREACIALDLTIITYSCAFQHRCSMRAILGRIHHEQRSAYKAQCKYNRRDHSCSEI